MRKHIFNAGPCKLSDRTLTNTAKAVLEMGETGQSVLEVSHRSADFQKVYDETVALMKEVLSIPDNYSVIFVGGGASLQFGMIPYNFLKTKAAYVNTGVWSKKALKEAELWGEVQEIASSADKNFTYYPDPKSIKIPADVDYLHITSNNTIRGTEIFEDIDSPVPMIADMSSDICSRPIDVSKYFMIYGGCQKNLGPAGATFVIIRNDFVDKVADRKIPTMLKYSTHVDNGSMFNTPPCVCIFAIRETLLWIKENGGVEGMEKRAIERCDALYNFLENSTVFTPVVEAGSRSRMNIPFLLRGKYNTPDMEKVFLEFVKTKNIVGVKGHRLVGGFRASTYNACTMEDVNALIAAMKEFEAKVK
ncbi:MAG: 3-phosphoserine/phosphohydroxythreonine transaminase [Paludibacteraceae bacterium]|nr:3-phosphoserine/phosphohydroxythreonine transaminase [Paludibacteraceae bacterium]